MHYTSTVFLSACSTERTYLLRKNCSFTDLKTTKTATLLHLLSTVVNTDLIWPIHILIRNYAPVATIKVCPLHTPRPLVSKEEVPADSKCT